MRKGSPCEKVILFCIVFSLLFLFVGSSMLQADAASDEGESSKRDPLMIVILAAIWLVILAAIIVSILRIKKRREREGERASKETD